MRDGRTEQIDPPDVVYRDPATPFVAGFIGTMNLIEGEVQGGGLSPSGGWTLAMPVPDGPATLAVRPEALEHCDVPGAGAAIHRVTDYGAHAIVDIDLADGLRLKALVADARGWAAGQVGRPAPRAPMPSTATTPSFTGV